MLFSCVLATFSGYTLLGCVVGLFFCLHQEGWEFEHSGNRYREFSSFLGLRKGQWHSADQIHYLSIISSRVASTIQSPFTSQGITDHDLYYKVVLLNATHSRKIDVFANKASAEARATAAELARILNVPIVKYSPPERKRK